MGFLHLPIFYGSERFEEGIATACLSACAGWSGLRTGDFAGS